MRSLRTPPTVLYHPKFITEEEERRLIACVNAVPKPKWQQLAHRRLQNWGGIPHPKGMICEQIPDWLMKYVLKVGELDLMGDKKPNHVLVNEYLPGQGIMPHTDGPLFHPVITTINLGSHTVLNFQQLNEIKDASRTKHKLSVLLEPRSLVVVKDDLYSDYLHSIDEIAADTISEAIVNPGNYERGDIIERETRISLTIRHVPKASKVKILLGR